MRGILAAAIYFAALVLVCAAYSGAGEAADLATSPRNPPDVTERAAGVRAAGGSPAVDHARSVTSVIRHVFRQHAAEALRVSWCESRWHTDARNGQYLGIFQMGSWERSRYGHGPGAWAQARAAHRYFVATGRDWSPWTCQP